MDDDGHDSSLSDQSAIGITVQYCGQQAWHEVFDLPTRVAQPGDLDDRR